MATTDTNVLYDVAFFNEFFPYLGYNFDEHQLSAIKQIVCDGLLQRDRMIELAAAKVGGLEVCSQHGQDFSDGSDMKTVVSQMRQNIKKRDPLTEEIKNKSHREGHWTSSFTVNKIKSKIGSLRVVAYNKILNKFHYFWIPNDAFQNINAIEIGVENYYGNVEPNWTGEPNRKRKWWSYEVNSFEELAKKRTND